MARTVARTGIQRKEAADDGVSEMNQARSRSLVLSLVLAAVSTASLSCGEETRFFIVQNQVPQEGCVVSGERSKAYRGDGRLDVSLVGDTQLNAYRMYPLLQNDLPAAGVSGAVEPNRLVVKAFRVTLELDGDAPAAARQAFDALAAELRSYEEPWAGTLEPGGATIPAGVTVVKGEVARRLRDAGVFDAATHLRVAARLRAVGARAEGDMTSMEFRFPIQLCSGCLVSGGGTCPIAERRFAGHACNIAQDEPVDCCRDGTALRCPAPVATRPMTTTPPLTTP